MDVTVQPIPKPTAAANGAVRPAVTGERVLVTTIAGNEGGGVGVMTRFALECLHDVLGLEPVLAYYAPYSLAPELSVPSFALGRKRVKTRESRSTRIGRSLETHELGAWLPELEFTHYLPTRTWRELIASCRYHVSVSGSVVPALVYAASRTPFLSWVATPWMGDRENRVAAFPPLRRALDAALVRPVTSRVESAVLKRGTVLALSDYTRRSLNRIAGAEVVADVLPMPVDLDTFVPRPERVQPGRVVFVGRYNDPRKNTRLFFDAIRRCADAGVSVTGVLVGDEPSADVKAALRASGAEQLVELHGAMPHAALAEELARADVFLIPSHQEGLCIAALEAMSCGCPVVSTRCGGPDEFVLDGVTGWLAASTPDALATRVTQIVRDRALRDRLGAEARRTVEQRYSRKTTERTFVDAFRRTFQGEK